MPNREWRKCETCEWFEKQQERCHLIAYTRGVDSFFPGKDFWCSEWKSSEPETCWMCHWQFRNKRGELICNCTSSPRFGLSVHLGSEKELVRDAGACEYFRRKDAD